MLFSRKTQHHCIACFFFQVEKFALNPTCFPAEALAIRSIAYRKTSFAMGNAIVRSRAGTRTRKCVPRMAIMTKTDSV